MIKHLAFAAIGIGLSACGPSLQNDPIYAALKANPPTQVPVDVARKLRSGTRSECEVQNEGQSNQYMTCWFSSGLPPQSATLSYFAPSLLSPPSPQNRGDGRGVLISDTRLKL